MKCKRKWVTPTIRWEDSIKEWLGKLVTKAGRHAMSRELFFA